jgi:hypothetical protein
MLDVLRHGSDKFRAAAADGLAMSAGMKVQSPAPGAEDFKGFGLEGIARECLRRAGYKDRDLGSKIKVASLVFKDARRQGAMSSSDFPSLLLDVNQKFLLRGYAEAARTFLPLVDVVAASDFKTRYGISLSSLPDLELAGEGEEYKYGTLKDSQESYQVQKYGVIISLTWEAVVNDDLKGLTKRMLRAGAAASRRESDVVWGLITSNPVMNEDSKTLFHANHNNLEASAVGPVTSERLEAGRASMRTQTDLKGTRIDIYPSYLAVPVAQATSAEVILRSRASTEAEANSGVINPWQSLVPISEPRLDDVSTKAWYLAADPSQVDMIELAYLEESEEPAVFQEESFGIDAINYKIRHCFGAGIMDYRGFFRNPGE